MIKIYNRQTKEYDIEKVAGGNLLNSLYGNGKLGLELLVKRKIYSAVTGIFCDMRLSARSIDWFIKEYDIDMSICKDKREDYKTFNDFFTRRVKIEYRRFLQSFCRKRMMDLRFFYVFLLSLFVLFLPL